MGQTELLREILPQKTTTIFKLRKKGLDGFKKQLISYSKP